MLTPDERAVVEARLETYPAGAGYGWGTGPLAMDDTDKVADMLMSQPETVEYG